MTNSFVRRAAAALLSAIGFAFATNSLDAAETLNEFTKLVRPNAAAGDRFGNSLSVEGRFLAAGADGDNVAGEGAGAVYLYDTVTLQALLALRGDDTTSGDHFGRSIDIDGSRILVGATGASVVNEYVHGGAAYLFDIATGQQVRKLHSQSGTASDFGAALALSQGKALIGAPRFGSSSTASVEGRVYLVDVGSGQVAGSTTSSRGEGLGQVIAMSGNHFAYGKPGTDLLANSGGPIVKENAGNFLFGLTANFLSGLGTMERVGGASYDGLGSSLAFSGASLIVGAPGFNNGEGAAYIFDTTTGNLLTTLASPRPGESIGFAQAVAMNDRWAVVSASRANDSDDRAGVAFVYSLETGEHVATLLASDGAANDFFGESLAILGDHVFVGVPQANEGRGAVYVFNVPEPSVAWLLGTGAASCVHFFRRRWFVKQ